MARCKACRRTLTNAISRKYGFGPECLKRAVEQGNAPLESLEELKHARRARKKSPRADHKPIPEHCDKTMDLFGLVREDALRNLRSAIADCKSCGVKVAYTIED